MGVGDFSRVECVGLGGAEMGGGGRRRSRRARPDLPGTGLRFPMWPARKHHVAKPNPHVANLFPYADSHECWRQFFAKLTHKLCIVDAISRL